MKKLRSWKPKRPNVAGNGDRLQWTTFSAVAGLAISLIALSWGRFDAYEARAPKLIITSQRLYLFGDSELSLVIQNLSPNNGAKFKISAIGFLKDYPLDEEGLLIELGDIDKKPGSVHSGIIGPGEHDLQGFAIDGLGETRFFRGDVESAKRFLYIRVRISYRDRFFIKHFTKNCYVLVGEVGYDKSTGVLQRCPEGNSMN